jgi:hypothetical protein
MNSFVVFRNVRARQVSPNYGDKNCADKKSVKIRAPFTRALSFNYKKISLEKCAGCANYERPRSAPMRIICGFAYRVCMLVRSGGCMSTGVVGVECLYKELQSAAISFALLL